MSEVWRTPMPALVLTLLLFWRTDGAWTAIDLLEVEDGGGKRHTT